MPHASMSTRLDTGTTGCYSSGVDRTTTRQSTNGRLTSMDLFIMKGNRDFGEYGICVVLAHNLPEALDIFEHRYHDLTHYSVDVMPIANQARIIASYWE